MFRAVVEPDLWLGGLEVSLGFVVVWSTGCGTVVGLVRLWWRLSSIWSWLFGLVWVISGTLDVGAVVRVYWFVGFGGLWLVCFGDLVVG